MYPISKEGSILSKDVFEKNLLSHWSYLIMILISYILADQLYYFLEIGLGDRFIKITNVFGFFRYAVLASVFLLLIARLTSKYIPELNIETPLKWYEWTFPLLILANPFTINQSPSGLKITLGIIEIINNGELLLFVFEVMIYLIASYGVMQILLLQKSAKDTSNAKYLKLIQSELSPIIAIVFSFIYLVQGMFRNRFNIIEYEMPVKLFLFVVFGFATIPNVPIRSSSYTNKLEENSVSDAQE